MANWFNPSPCRQFRRIPDDDKFIACALSAKAEFLVTGDKRHYRESWLSGTKLVNAGELAQLIAATLEVSEGVELLSGFAVP